MKASMLDPTRFYLPNKIQNKKTENHLNQNKKTASFNEILQEKLSEVNSLQQKADKLTESFLAGEPVELHKVMLAMEKADLALQLTVQVRNKLIEAYQEISRMQI
ncbi:MAG: flagellar hook-basal body complex protein FliE [Clostridia bacterium]|nr:flagellar hook-basal body complex protein FliE [Clostridia bacterium]